MSLRRAAYATLRDAWPRRATKYAAARCSLAWGMPDWSTEEILAVHVRMHKAEGELFRDVLVAGARVCDLELTTLREKSALDDAAKMLGLTRARLDAHLVALGKTAGPPWGKDQKEAAAAALAALSSAKRGKMK
jgi:hypothetical protein